MSGLREQLQDVYDQHGKLTPELVRDEARPKSHPLHAAVYDKSPKDAADAYYLRRAHELIQSVKVTYREATDTEKGLRGRAFLAVRDEGPDTYVYEPYERVAEDPFKRQLVLREMEREWRALHSRYQTFAEFLDLVRADLDKAA